MIYKTSPNAPLLRDKKERNTYVANTDAARDIKREIHDNVKHYSKRNSFIDMTNEQQAWKGGMLQKDECVRAMNSGS